MNKEQIAKLRRDLESMYDLAVAIEAKASETFGQVWLLDELAERTTSPVSQMTDEQIDAIWKNMTGFDVKDGVELREFAKAKRIEFARAILAAAAPHAQDNEGEKT